MAKVLNRRFILNLLIAAATLCFQFNGLISGGTTGIFPLLPLGFTVVVAMYSSELQAFFCGIIMGIFVDSSSSALFSFNTVAYPIIAVATALLVRHLFNNNIRSCTVLSFLFALLLTAARFIVFNFSDIFNNMLRHFLNTTVPSAMLTAVFAVALYLAEKAIFKQPR